MSDRISKRIAWDLQDLNRNDPDGLICGLKPIDPNNIRDLEGFVMGPPDSPYEGGKFCLKLSLPDQYPFVPPKVWFTTRLWHPNVSSATGMICLSLLDKDWSSAYSLFKVLLAIQSLFNGKILFISHICRNY